MKYITSTLILTATLALPSAATADDHDLEAWCTESQARLALCVLGAAVVVPLVALEELGQAFEASCTAEGGTYTAGAGAGYDGQWACVR